MQPDGGRFSTEIPLSQIRLAYVELTKTNKQTDQTTTTKTRMQPTMGREHMSAIHPKAQVGRWAMELSWAS